MNSQTPMIDPIQAMENTSKGRWVFVDKQVNGNNNNNNNDYDDMDKISYTGAVESLVEFLAASACATQSSGGGILLLGDNSPPDLSEFYPHQHHPQPQRGGGARGVAWVCSSKEDVAHAATLTKSLSFSSAFSMATTERRILLAATATADCNDNDDDATPEDNDTVTSSPPSLPLALVIPFDEQVWEAAVLLLLSDSNKRRKKTLI